MGRSKIKYKKKEEKEEMKKMEEKRYVKRINPSTQEICFIHVQMRERLIKFLFY